MAQTDDIPIRITSPDYRDSRNSQLEEWLAKEAEDAGRLGDNESSVVPGCTELYPREPKAVEGPDRTSEESLQAHQHDAAQRARRDVAAKAYANLPIAARTDRALLNANLAHAASGDFSSHSVLLQGGAKEAAATLSDRVRRLGLGRG